MDPRDFRIGRDILPSKRNLSRYVKWPRYVRIQRQRAIIKKRIKVPPSINQFSKTLDKNQASSLFTLMSKYRPESGAEKKQRLTEAAGAESKNQDVKKSKAPKHIKYGLNHITDLVESKKAKLVVIAHDVDPIELVVWLPALCRKMNVPFCIIKGKSRLGQLVNKKNAAVAAITKVKSEDDGKLKTLCDNFTTQFNDTVEKKWGGGIMGLKTEAKLTKRKAAIEAELAKKNAINA